MQDPHALTRRVEDVFGAGVELVVMDESDVRAYIFVFPRQNDGKFGFVFDCRVDEPAADADDATFVDEGVVSDER